MSTPFDARLARVRRAIEREFAAEWIFRPMAKPNGPNGATAADPDRAVVDPFVAVFREVPALAFDNRNVASFSPVPSAGSVPTISFVDTGIVVRAGDRVENRATGEVWSLSDPQPRGRGRISWRLSTVKT